MSPVLANPAVSERRRSLVRACAQPLAVLPASRRVLCRYPIRASRPPSHRRKPREPRHSELAPRRPDLSAVQVPHLHRPRCLHTQPRAKGLRARGAIPQTDRNCEADPGLRRREALAGLPVVLGGVRLRRRARARSHSALDADGAVRRDDFCVVVVLDSADEGGFLPRSRQAAASGARRGRGRQEISLVPALPPPSPSQLAGQLVVAGSADATHLARVGDECPCSSPDSANWGTRCIRPIDLPHVNAATRPGSSSLPIQLI
jgi:hypothetical protein